jgi:hypothetical protein
MKNDLGLFQAMVVEAFCVFFVCSVDVFCQPVSEEIHEFY